MSQQVLPLKLPTYFKLENFFGEHNQNIARTLEKALENFEPTPVFIKAEQGLGKTHLLNALVEASKYYNRNALYLSLPLIKTLSPTLLENLEHYEVIAIDDVHSIAGDLSFEPALFHLYNRMQIKNHKLIFSACHTPRHINFSLADLKSRLEHATLYTLLPLSDDEKKQMLKGRAHAHGFILPEEVADYLLAHCFRSLPQLLELLETIEQASLTNHRKITVPFVKSILLDS